MKYLSKAHNQIIKFFGGLPEWGKFYFFHETDQRQTFKLFSKKAMLGHVENYISRVDQEELEVKIHDNCLSVFDSDNNLIFSIKVNTDQIDALKSIRKKASDESISPQCGDLVFSDNKLIGRIGIVSEESIQLSNGSFFIDNDGRTKLSYGSLRRSIGDRYFRKMEGDYMSRFWTFDDNKIPGPDSSIEFEASVSAWSIPTSELDDY